MAQVRAVRVLDVQLETNATILALHFDLREMVSLRTVGRPGEPLLATRLPWLIAMRAASEDVQETEELKTRSNA